MWPVLLSFVVDIFTKSLRFIASVIGNKAFAWAKLLSYLTLCYTAYYSFVSAVNLIIDEISDISKPELIVVAFSYLPLNIQDCLNIILYVHFLSYIYLYKDRIYRLVYDLFKTFGLSSSK